MNYFIVNKNDTLKEQLSLGDLMTKDFIHENYKEWFQKDFDLNFKHNQNFPQESYIKLKEITKKSDSKNNELLLLTQKAIQEIRYDLPEIMSVVSGINPQDFIENIYLDFNPISCFPITNTLSSDKLLFNLYEMVENILLLEEISVISQKILLTIETKKSISKEEIENLIKKFNYIFKAPDKTSYYNNCYREISLLKELLYWFDDSNTKLNFLPYKFFERVLENNTTINQKDFINALKRIDSISNQTANSLKQSLQNGYIYNNPSSDLAYTNKDATIIFMQNLLDESFKKYQDITDTLPSLNEKLNKNEIFIGCFIGIFITTIFHEYAHHIYKNSKFPKWEETITKDYYVNIYSLTNLEEAYCELFGHYWAAYILSAKEDIQYYNENLDKKILGYLLVQGD